MGPGVIQRDFSAWYFRPAEEVLGERERNVKTMKEIGQEKVERTCMSSTGQAWLGVRPILTAGQSTDPSRSLGGVPRPRNKGA